MALGDETPTAAPTPPTPVPSSTTELTDGRLLFGDVIVGEVVGNELRVNLGFARFAGLDVICEDDPTRDNHREGLAFVRRARG